MTPADRTLRLLGEALIALADAPPDGTTKTVTETVTLAATWNLSRLYDVPENTRLDATDVAAILGVARGAVYKKVKRDRLPHRKRRDQTLVFLAGDLRRALEDGERVVVPVPEHVSKPRRHP